MALEKLQSFRIDSKTHEKLETIAKLKRRRTSELVRIIVEDYTMQFDDISTMQNKATSPMGNKADF